MAALICLLSVSGAAHAQSNPAGSAGQTTSGKAAKQQDADELDFNANDPAMRRAFDRAQRTLDDFLRATSGTNQNLDSVGVRVRLSEGKYTEYLWVMPVETADGKQFRGQLNDVPRTLKRLTLAQDVTFPRSDIVDWMYYDKQTKIMHGHHTTCVLMKDAPASEKAEMKKRYGLDCQRTAKR